MRKLLNRLLRPVGYRIERLPWFERKLEELQRCSPAVKFVQIGANDGVRFDDLYAFVTGHCSSGLVVEPLPDAFERLRHNYADYPSIMPVNVAVFERPGTMTIYRVAHGCLSRYPGWAGGIASFDRDHLVRHGIAPEDIEALEVACMPFMQLVEEHGVLDAQLLQLDTEGYDDRILQMIDFDRFQPSLIKYEHKNLAPAQREAVHQLLQRRGYRCATDGNDTVAWRAPL